jgi:hypothetical protein
MTDKARGFTAVMNQRVEAADSLDDFPTPPWATRALAEIAMVGMNKGQTVLEPAAGRGLMSEVLKEYWRVVESRDIADYGYPLAMISDYTEETSPTFRWYDWVITNPPFGDNFVPFWQRAMEDAATGVAFFLRGNLTEGIERYQEVFRDNPPTRIAYFSERVPLQKHSWAPKASTATAYAWFIWDKDAPHGQTGVLWIPPGQRKALTRADDEIRFAHCIDTPERRAYEAKKEAERQAKLAHIVEVSFSDDVTAMTKVQPIRSAMMDRALGVELPGYTEAQQDILNRTKLVWGK